MISRNSFFRLLSDIFILVAVIASFYLGYSLREVRLVTCVSGGSYDWKGSLQQDYGWDCVDGLAAACFPGYEVASNSTVYLTKQGIPE